MVQRARQLAVNVELLDNCWRQIGAVLGKQFGAFQRALGLLLALAVKLIAQRLKVSIKLLTLLLRQFRAQARQLLAVAGGELGKFEFVNAGF